MTADTPYQWLSRVAESDPDRDCLIDDVSVMSYREVRELVDARTSELLAHTTEWQIVPVDVSLVIGSIVEILAIQHAGAVPFPITSSNKDLPSSTAPGMAVCIGTSGTSGSPRVVPLTFANVSASVTASRDRLGNGPEDRWLACLPLDHVGGLSVVWRTLEAGGSAVVAPFDASGRIIERRGPTIASMVPTMVKRLLETNQSALASIGTVLVGGASLASDLSQQCLDADIRLVPTYGLTEAASQVATATSEVTNVTTGHVGPPLDGMDVKIVHRDGGRTAPGETGLIAIAGAAVFSGYLGDKARDGWFVTNDLGRLDTAGHLYVDGRVDDVIVSGGRNVSLWHVTRAITSHDSVRDVCVVGIDDIEWGTIGCAMVVSDVELEALDTMMRRDLKPHERPKRWLRRDSIPALGNGKHDLMAVKAAFEEEPWT